MAIGLTITKPLSEKGRSLCTLVGKSMHAKVMAVVLDTNGNVIKYT